MNIERVSKLERNATVVLNSSELVTLCNLLYEATKEKDARVEHFQLYSDLMIARDLSQYGGIDGFCLGQILKCRERLGEKEDMEYGREENR